MAFDLNWESRECCAHSRPWRPQLDIRFFFSAIQRGPVTSRSEQNVSSCRLVFFILVVFILFYKRIFFFRPDDWSSNLLIEFMAEPAASPECRRKLSANIVNAVVTYGPCLVWWPSHWLRPVDARSWPSFLASTKKKKKNKVAAQLSDFTNWPNGSTCTRKKKKKKKRNSASLPIVTCAILL